MSGKYHPARGKINIVKEIKMCFKKRKPEPSTCGSQVYDPETTRQIIREHIKANIGEKRYNKLDCPPEISSIDARVSFGPFVSYTAKLSYRGNSKTLSYYDHSLFPSDLEIMEWTDRIDRAAAEAEAFFPFAYWQVTYGRNSWHNTVYTVYTANSESALESICDGLYKWIADIRTNTFVRFNVEDIYSITEYEVETIDDIPFWSHRMEEFGKVRIPPRGATRLE